MRCTLLINLFQWICRVKRRGGKQGFNEDWINGMGNKQKEKEELGEM